MLVAFIMVIPAVLRPLVRASMWCLAGWASVEGKLAAEQLLRRPTRTGLTVGVVVVAVSTCVGLGNAIVNNVNDVRGWFRRTMQGDVLVTDPSSADQAVTAPARSQVRAMIAKQEGVDYLVELHFVPVRINGSPTMCVVRDFAPQAVLPWSLSSSVETKTRAALSRGDAIFSSVIAKKLGLSIGDKFQMEARGRILPGRVAAVVNDYWMGGMAVFLERTAVADLFELGPASIYIVEAKPQASVPALRTSLSELADREGLVVHSFAELRGQIDQLINGVVGALWGVLGVGVVVGGMAVANTLTMSVFEQTREIGLLRVVGMTRRQVRKMVLCESLLLGIVGVLMGMLAGETTALIIHLCNEPLLDRPIPFVFHAWLLAVGAGGGLLVAMLAAWPPGHRAARLDLLSAIAYE